MQVQHPSFQSPLISENAWRSLFPREDYERCLRKDPSLPPQQAAVIKGHSLKYLIALNEPEAKINEWVVSLGKKKSLQLQSSYTKYKFTPLIMAVMKNQQAVASALIETTEANSPERKALFEEKDCFGWTALHHAALLANDEMMRVLISKGADADVRTPLGATFGHLRAMAGLERAVRTYDSIDFSPLGGAPVHIDLGQFEKLTGLKKYTDQPFYSVDQLSSLWQTAPQVINEELQVSTNFFTTIYREMMQNSPRLVVKEESPKSFGLYADQDLEFGQGIIEYTGEVVPINSSSFAQALKNQVSRYQYKDQDPKEIGNAARFMNDGFPNAVAVAIYNTDGRCERHFFVVSDPEGIKRGKPIIWDYRSGEVMLKWNIVYHLGRREEMQACFKQTPLATLREQYNKETRRVIAKYQRGEAIIRKDMVSKFGLEPWIQHLYTTPAALIDLVCHHLISLQEVKELLPTDFMADLRALNPQHIHWMKRLIDLLQSLKDLVEPLNGDLKQEIYASILDMQTRMTTIQVVRGIQVIVEWTQSLKTSPSEASAVKSSWQVLKDNLNQKLPSYREYPFPLEPFTSLYLSSLSKPEVK